MIKGLWDKKWFTFIRWLYLTLFAVGLVGLSAYLALYAKSLGSPHQLCVGLIAGALGTLSGMLLFELLSLGIKLHKSGWANPDKGEGAND